MLKRAYLSITRRKNKTIVLFIILFVVANLVITTIAIKNATGEATKFAKQSIGSEVTLSADMQGARKQMTATSQEEKEETKSTFTMPTVTVTDALKIAKSKYITGYSYGFTAYANVKDLEVVESEMSKMGNITVPGEQEKTSASENKMGNMSQGGEGNFKVDMKDIMSQVSKGNVSIEAVNNFNNISGFVNGTIEITSGKAISSDDENTAMISYDFAALNELKVGDKITLKHTETEKEITLTIVGIYDTSDTGSDMKNMMMNSSNTIYTSLKTGEAFMDEETYNEGAYTITSCLYYLADPEDYDAFVEEANTLVTDLEEKNLKLSIDQTTYDQMVGSIESIGGFATIVFWVVVGASILIITLVINGQIKERNYEMGILLSLGEKKKKIVEQIAIELLIVATIAFILSIGTGTLISKAIGNNLTTSQETLATEQSELTGRPNMPMNMGEQNNTEQVNIDVSVGITECALLFGIGYVIVMFAMILPSLSIFKYDPKAIFTRRE